VCFAGQVAGKTVEQEERERAAAVEAQQRKAAQSIEAKRERRAKKDAEERERWWAFAREQFGRTEDEDAKDGTERSATVKRGGLVQPSTHGVHVCECV
jgi:hypothetical protein